jgi:predicted metal-dependent phosphoesterase TrpH
MPAGQPFTLLCQQLARPRHAGRADLHLHTTHSDGTYTPEQLVELARRCGLAAIAVTDHDTLSAVAVARAAAPRGLEIIAGVEISTEYAGRELHLLAYFVDPDHPGLNVALHGVRQGRIERFRAMVERLRRQGVSVSDETPTEPAALGRPHLAALIVAAGRARSVSEAFRRYLVDGGAVAVPKKRLPVAEALDLVRSAGGVAAYAHPPYDCEQRNLAELQKLGLGAIEVEYPELRPSWRRQLRDWAADLGLAISGGSDCHGPGKRSVGTCTVSGEELERLRLFSRERSASAAPERSPNARG